MNIQPITPSFNGNNAVYRVSKQYGTNALKPFFYNDVLNVVREQKLPALIKGHVFDVTFDKKYQQQEMKLFTDTLNKVGIEFERLI